MGSENGVLNEGIFMRKRLTMAAAALAVVAVAGLTLRAADPKSISDVMKEAHKGKPTLLAKVTSGKAEKEDKEKLLALYQDLAKNEPPQGDKDLWKKKNDAILKAAQEIVDGKKSETALTKATNCMACHSVFRPK
jgi:hypothetical protein